MEFLNKLKAYLKGELSRPSPKNGRDEPYVPEGFTYSDYLALSDKERKDLEEYLSIPIKSDGFKVYRCRNCEVRIANEEDMVRKPAIRQPFTSFPKEKNFARDLQQCPSLGSTRFNLSAVFRQTFNLVNKGRYVHCYRCGFELFPRTANDEWNLIIPMMLKNRVYTLKKTDYRLLVLCEDIDGLPFYIRDEREIKTSCASEKGKNIQKEIIGAIASSDITRRIKALTEIISKGKACEVTRLFVAQTSATVGWLKEVSDAHASKEGNGFTYYKTTTYHEQEEFGRTYDLSLFFRYKPSTGGVKVGHITDYLGSITGCEKSLVLCWLASGGNMLFGMEAYLSKRYQSDTTEEEFEKVAVEVETNEDDITDRQHGYARLIRDGHYLGTWSTDKTRNSLDQMNDMYSTPRILEKSRRALEGKLLYPNWCFLHDFCPTTLERKPNPMPINRPAPKCAYFAQNAKDKYLPNRPCYL